MRSSVCEEVSSNSSSSSSSSSSTGSSGNAAAAATAAAAAGGGVAGGGSQWGGEAWDIFTSLAILVVEGRTPGGEKGFHAGPHCPTLNHQHHRHHCNTNNHVCVQVEWLLRQLRVMWGVGVGVALEVLVAPNCKHGAERVASLDTTTAPTNNLCLIERWNFVIYDRKVASASAGGASLVAAVRSFLHFSQLSAWLSVSGGRHPPNVLYRLTVSSPVFCSKFTEEPEEHVFPVAFIGQDTSLKVSVRSLPRRDKVPMVVCPEHHHEQTRAETSVCARPPQPAEIGMCEDDLRRSVMKARLGEVSVSRASRSQSPDTQLGESLLDPPNSLSRFPRRFQSPSRAGSPSLETPEHLICRPRHPQPSPSPLDLGIGSLGPSLRPFSWTQARYPSTSQQHTQLHHHQQQQQQQHQSHLNVLGNISDSNLQKTDFSHVACNQQCSGGFQPQFSCASQEHLTQQRQQPQQETFSFTPNTSSSSSQRGSYNQASYQHGTNEKYQYFPEYGSDAFCPSVTSHINLQIGTVETKTSQRYSGLFENRKDQPTPISPLSPSFDILGDNTDFQSSPFDYSPDSSKLSSRFFENQCLHPPIFKNIIEPETPKVFYNQQLFNKQKESFNQYEETKTIKKNTRINNEIGTKTKYPQVKELENSLQSNQKISIEIPDSYKEEQKNQSSDEHEAEGQAMVIQAVPISKPTVECSNGNVGRKNTVKSIPPVKSRTRSNWKQRSVCDESVGIVDDEMRPCCGQSGKHLCDSTEDLTEALKQEHQDKERMSTRTKSAPGKSVSGSRQPTQSSTVQHELLRGKLNFSLTPRETLEILSVLRQPTPVPPLRINSHPGQCEEVNELSSSSGEARVSKMHTGPARVERLNQQTTHDKPFRDSGIKAELKDSGIKEWRDSEGKEWKQSGLKKWKTANYNQKKKESQKDNNGKGDKECLGKEETAILSSDSSSLPKSLGHNEKWCHSTCGDEKGVSKTSCTRPKSSSLFCASVTKWDIDNGSTQTSDGGKSCDIFSVKSLAATGRSSSGACISPELQPTAAKCDNKQSDNTSTSFSPNVKRSHMTKKQGKVFENRICQSGDEKVFESNKSFSSCLEVDHRSACVDAVKVTVKTNIYTANSEPAADASCISSSECLSPRKLTTQTSVNSPFSAILSSIQNEDYTDKQDEHQNCTPYCLHDMHYQNKQHDREKVRRALKFDDSNISKSEEQKTSIADAICKVGDDHKENKSLLFEESTCGASICDQRESREGFIKGGSLLKHLMTTRTQTSQGSSSSDISSNNIINNNNSQGPSQWKAYDSEHSDTNGETPRQNGHHSTCEGQLSNGVEHGPENGLSKDYVLKEPNGFHSEEDQDEEVIKLFNGNLWRPIPTANDMAEFRRSLDSATNMVFHCKTGLPLTSSPAPQRRGKRFDYDSSLNTVAAIKRSTSFYCSALYNCEGSDGEGPEEPSGRRSIGTDVVQLKQKTAPLSTSAPATVTCSNLLGSFEECVLNGRLEPVSTVQGFTAEIAASGAFIPKHISKPVTVFFYTLCDNDQISSPYMGHINLGKKGYHVPNKGTVQVTLFNPHDTVVKMFVVMYDLSDMPPNCRTFVRQRTLNMPVGATDKDLNAHQWLRYLIHLRFASSKSGKVYLHTDIRMLIFRKSDADAATLHKTSTPYELRSFTHGPTNPKFSPRK